jgi:hypothetical protein
MAIAATVSSINTDSISLCWKVSTRHKMYCLISGITHNNCLTLMTYLVLNICYTCSYPLQSIPRLALYFQLFWIIIFLEQVVKGTLAGLFVMINSLLLIVVNNPARIDCKNPFGIIDLSNTFKFILYLSNYLHI